MILGAVLAGGRSSRFGSDKAMAEVDGHTLLAHSVDTLARWCDHVVVVGRETAPAPTIPDWPHAGMGPLGGLAAALRLAADGGYHAVLSCGVDSLGLPDDLQRLLGLAPACLESQPIVGIWHAETAPVIEAILDGEGPHAMRRFAQAVGARQISLDHEPVNINTPGDLAAFQARRGPLS
jgi:molybdopterin-guanine dinucleotide biosynthesis protein A